MYTPFGSKRDIENVVEQIGEQIGNFIHQVTKEGPFAQRPQDAQKQEAPAQGGAPSTAWPQIDVEEDDANVYISAELPGIEKSGIDITVSEERVMTIRGEKKQITRPGARSIGSERSFGTFSRSIFLPESAEPTAIQAEFSNGLLVITVGKKEQNNGIRVEIR